jgi:NADPH2:quinone reductase
MRAAYYERNGTAREVLQIGEIEAPRAGPGEVRVKLATSGVNPSDVKSRLGTTRKIAFPRVVPHSDGAGVIDEVGTGVPKSRIRERVWVWNGQWKRAFGTAAEFIVLPSSHAVPLPASVAFEASQYVIQFAKIKKAKVIATVSSSEKADLAREAGADQIVDYKKESVGERVLEITGKRGVDAVIELDLTANAKLIPAVLRPKGTVVVYGTGPEAVLPAAFCLVNSIRLQFFLV